MSSDVATGDTQANDPRRPVEGFKVLTRNGDSVQHREMSRFRAVSTSSSAPTRPMNLATPGVIFRRS